MNYLLLVNKTNSLSKDYIAYNLVDVSSKYKDGIKLDKMAYECFLKMQNDGLKRGYNIDIMSGYRDYIYQEKLYNKLLKEKGFAYTFRSIAKPGCSEHQTGLAIDICIYRDDKCYIEHEIEDMEEVNWLINNCYKYGFILRYPLGREDKTGYNYEPWHFRYVGDIAKYLYKNKILFDDYVKNIVK
jgi:D-alanyl-D-alanine carboxypeptidase